MFKVLQNVKYSRIPRLSTGIEELDWIYGGEDDAWGLPSGKISLWSGPSGTGKSKSLITVAKNITSIGAKVIYFQNEVTLGDFRAWAGVDVLPPTLYASETTKLDEQIADIRKSKAALAIIDSINQIEEFGGGHKSAIQHIYRKYRILTKETGVHVIFICQLDKQNQIKGGSDLLFLADISIDLDHYMENKEIVKHHFTISAGSKNRYGKLHVSSVWRHLKTGAICISENRFFDSDWCEAHGLELQEPIYNEDGSFKTDGYKLKVPKGHFGTPIKDPVSGAIFFRPVSI